MLGWYSSVIAPTLPRRESLILCVCSRATRISGMPFRSRTTAAIVRVAAGVALSGVGLICSRASAARLASAVGGRASGSPLVAGSALGAPGSLELMVTREGDRGLARNASEQISRLRAQASSAVLGSPHGRSGTIHPDD